MLTQRTYFLIRVQTESLPRNLYSYVTSSDEVAVVVTAVIVVVVVVVVEVVVWVGIAQSV